MGQLPFLSGLERNHEQGVRLALARRVRDNQTVAVRTPGKVRRSDEEPSRTRISASLRSGPPSGGISRNSLLPASD